MPITLSTPDERVPAMRHRSRYLRDQRPTAGLIIQSRDVALLSTIEAYRYVHSDHLHALHFAPASRRIGQARLRLLWEHRYVERLYLPGVVAAGSLIPPALGQPLYTLSSKGARFLAARREGLPSSSPRPLSAQALPHHLITIDFLVAATIAGRGRSDVVLEGAEHESTLWRRLRRYQSTSRTAGYYLVPDGAVTLSIQPGGQLETFYIEIVRADVRGGNRHQERKMERYVELHHAGFFRRVFGHEHLRAVIFATTSLRRAEHFRALAQRLRHGRRLFWFGTYVDRDERGREVSTLTPASILSSRWMNTNGEHLSLIPPGAGPPDRDSGAG